MAATSRRTSPELNEEAELAEFEFNSTLTSLFNRLYYPGRHPKDGDGAAVGRPSR